MARWSRAETPPGVTGNRLNLMEGMKMLKVKDYSEFNFRRYSNPWIAKLNEELKPDFDAKAGGYSGGYNKGEAGYLYITQPEEGAIYMYGQKDYRGGNTEREYVKIVNGVCVSCNKLGDIE